jgi:hypothetical protein
MTARNPASAAFAAGIVILLSASSGCESRKVGAITTGVLDLEVVLKESGKPSGGILLELDARGRIVARGNTDEAGRASFRRVTPGKSTIRAKDPEGVLMTATLEVEVPGKVRVELEAGVEALLDVLDDSGNGLEDVAVTVWPLGQSARRFSFESGGNVRFGPLPSGHAKILVAARDHRAAILDAELKPGSKRREQDLGEVRLVQGGKSLRGKVQFKRQKRPLETVLRYEGIGQLAGVREDGSFEFHGLPVTGAKGKVMLVLLDGSKEVYARELVLPPGNLDVGAIRLD